MDRPALLTALAGGAPLTLGYLNPNAWHVQKKDKEFARTLAALDIILPDGMAIKKAARWLHGLDIQRQSFDEENFANALLDKLSTAQTPVLFIGAKPEKISAAAARLCAHFPKLKLIAAYDGYRDDQSLMKAALDKTSSVIFLGLGSPRQENLALALRAKGHEGSILCVGGFFDKWAETANFYPALVQKLEIRWLWRVVRDPRQFFKRYFWDYRHFVEALLRARLMPKPKAD